MPVLSEGGKSRIWRHLVGLLRETDERSTVSPENPKEVQLPNLKSTFYTCNFWDSSRIKANQWNFEELSIWTEMVCEGFKTSSIKQKEKKKSPCWRSVVCQPALMSQRIQKFGSSTGPKTSAASKGSSRRPTL